MKKIIISAFLLIVIVIIGLQFISPENQSETSSAVSKSEVPVMVKTSVVVAPQSNTETVFIKKATLTESGFLVLREVIDGTAAQIVEISQYLESGTYTDISIPVGEFYAGDSELMVVVYTDVGKDQILNDLDQPFVDNNDSSVAAYVSTGLPVADEVFNPSQETFLTN